MESLDFETIPVLVTDRQGEARRIDVPPDAEYNLMEILKTFGYKMRATCGGMGLCADCHCSVLEGMRALPPPTDQEAQTLDLIPQATMKSRLACQIAPGPHLQGLSIRLLGVDHY
jgi:ferredoxin